MTTQIERTTKEIITPNQHKVIVYDYITGGEFRKVQSIFLDGITASDVSGDIMKKMPVTLVFKAQEVALKLLIVSVDGCEKDIAYQKAMDLLPEDLEFVFTEIDKYTTAKNTTLKKNEESLPNTSQPDAQ